MTPFDVDISGFRNALDNNSKGTLTLGEWLDLVRTENEYTPLVFNYRNTTDPKQQYELKRSTLPAVSTGAVCSKGRVPEKLTGYVCADIDAGDNEQKGAELRDAIARIPWVAAAHLSTGGDGVAAYIRIADPSRQKEHVEQIFEDLEQLGFTPD